MPARRADQVDRPVVLGERVLLVDQHQQVGRLIERLGHQVQEHGRLGKDPLLHGFRERLDQSRQILQRDTECRVQRGRFLRSRAG